jgi:hypothetical protein
MICGRGRGKEKNDSGIERHHFAIVSGLLRKVENTFRRGIASNGQYFEGDSICNT